MPARWRRLSLGSVLARLTAIGDADSGDVGDPGAATPVGGAMPVDGAMPVGAAGLTAPTGRGSAPSPVDPVAARDGVPVTLGGAPVRQVDPTTCGSAVLLMLAATGDPALAAWLEDGRLPHGIAPHRVPPEIPPTLLTGPLGPGAAARRIGAAQTRIKERTSARAVGKLSWPASYGTPPWTAAREARFPGVRYHSRPLDDTSAQAAALLARAHAATVAGIPVPLYTGGDLGAGPATAVPRHVVLAVPPPPGPGRGYDEHGRPVLHLYEPSSARVYRLLVAELLGRTERSRALGGWTHVAWVLLPTTDGAVAAGSADLASADPAGQGGRAGSHRAEEES
ncbi:hypothetical protein V5H98_04125 [Georgenia sp. M64]|uniref:hypothetical protein n=1 Tax=Georgenia sp. M64 TaxID=3120520 RepID=UPI0030E1D2F4